MQNARITRIDVTVNVSVEDRGDYWAAYIEPLGMTVYGDTKAAAIDRVDTAMNFFTKHYAKGDVQKVIDYLKRHGVPSQVIYSDMVEDDEVRRIPYPVGLSLEAAASV